MLIELSKRSWAWLFVLINQGLWINFQKKLKNWAGDKKYLHVNRGLKGLVQGNCQGKKFDRLRELRNWDAD